MKEQKIHEISKQKEDNLLKLCTNLTLTQAELLMGSLLGDGNLQTASKTAGTWRARFLQGERQKAYLFYKYETLKNFVGTEPRRSSNFDRRTNTVYTRYSFNTKTFSEVKPLAEMFYTWNEETRRFDKKLPKNIGDFLTPGVIAIWFMDDGSAKWIGHSNSIRFSTDCFSQEEIGYLQKGLKDYGIDTTLQQKRRNQWTLATSESSANTLKVLLSEKIHPDFYSKVPWMV
uniref:Putative LAGLIDADG homing endonuclease n=1 Tax=Dunaliella salina TaxID=3046 RepID=A0A1C8XRK5_DUNSA|nr:putative LAGLIDADG homing endonuclease [Dunaliella salina]AOH77119.1 putative LAGLIDADG homing endonuclease [Dunaliella salina]|mmetsp:Transcript_7493/g.19955  ORF Transcript_7493/g.19955 Transcript_7493/m.19955 type:complete len:230 (+) Transcript_7493:247-936(+)